MLKLARLSLVLWPLTIGGVMAQVAAPSPLTGEQAAAQLTPGSWIAAEQRADAALQNGFPATAAAGYRAILRDPALPAEAKPRTVLALVTALLDAGEVPAAESALRDYAGPRNSAYQLRAGLIAIALNRKEAARTALGAGKIEELSAADRGWWHFLQGGLAEADGQWPQAIAFYDQALQAAVSGLQRARFLLAQEQARLRSQPVNESQLSNQLSNMERFRGQRIGYVYMRTYATSLAGLGRTAEAQTLLQRQLALLPPEDRSEADQIGLLLGLIAGEGSAAGRQAFRQLLRDGQRSELRQLALLLLVRGSKSATEREQLRSFLSDLIRAPVQHPILEDLMLARAQLALADQLYAAAEEDARALLERYPGTKLKPAALGVRLAVAWDSKRYRTAADLIVQLRATLTDGRERAELGVLLAEAFFRSEDYRNAADAYTAAFDDHPPEIGVGVLIFQRVLSDIRAGQLEAAARQLDAAAARPGFDALNRWQAEWNLVKEMQVRGQSEAAQARVDKLLAGGAGTGVPEELRIRLMWLRAKLSFDNNQPETTLRQSDELLALLAGGAGVPDELRMNVTSTTQLLKAQALLALNRDQEGLAMLDKLRADFRATAAAQYSYLVQAAHSTQRGDMAGAQRVLISFVDSAEYRRSEYAPLALYEAAINLERQGLDRHLEEANKLLERLVNSYPQSELVFYARLKQGDLLRKLNFFPQARQVYEDLINNSSLHPDVLLAQLALADSLFAQGANNVVNYESASAIFERLRDLPSAPVDLRVEAGYKWGYALAKRAEAAKAQTVLWSVIQVFLLDPAMADKLGARGRYWVSRSLLELGQIHEEAGRLDEAQRAYQLIIERKLSGAQQAQAKLARFGAARP